VIINEKFGGYNPTRIAILSEAEGQLPHPLFVPCLRSPSRTSRGRRGFTEHGSRAAEHAPHWAFASPVRDWRGGNGLTEHGSRAAEHAPQCISNRFWPTNRSYRKQTIKPCLTGSRIDIKDSAAPSLACPDVGRERIREGRAFVSSGPLENRTPLTSTSRADSPARAFAWEPNLAPVNVEFAPFLPGFGLRVECDVTPTKQMPGEFLPGATTAQWDSAAPCIFAPKTDVLTVMDPTGCAHSASRMLPSDAGGKLLRP
jgi:hypothetical protein